MIIVISMNWAVRVCAACIFCLLVGTAILHQMLVRMLPDWEWQLRQRDVHLLVQAGNRSFPLLPRQPCPRHLAIVVLSAVGHFVERRAIRSTWAGDAVRPTARVFFLLGTTANGSLQRRVEEESIAHRDIIQGEFLDSYYNLTLKTIHLLKWASERCPQTRYVVKTDDDIYVNVPNLIAYLRESASDSRFLAGKLVTGEKPARNPFIKFYVHPRLYPADEFPDYLSGSGYVMSIDVAAALLRTAMRMRLLYFEDVFTTGLVAEKLGIARVDSSCFTYWEQEDQCCQRRLVTINLMTPERMRRTWRVVHDADLPCDDSASVEEKTRHGEDGSTEEQCERCRNIAVPVNARYEI
ncbi:hypothetical protein HPB48_021480 [Haemaphysalis longicornis]|uniref:Hexosyltransferase n=1 Tax=Haemaphysalis longicornis TaxID=44386 RepID=A0A9J6FYM0_HAELO|nr:hypothetical protein HPB48_021480 [Haemaphysalis longicornis]